MEVHLNSGSGKLSVEFTIIKTIPNFDKGAKKILLNWTISFKEFKNVLKGQYKTTWKQAAHNNFPKPINLAIVPAEQDR